MNGVCARKNILFRVVELVIFSVPAFRHIPTGHILRLAALLGGKCEKEPKGPLFLIYYLLGRYDYRVIEGGYVPHHYCYDSELLR